MVKIQFRARPTGTGNVTIYFRCTLGGTRWGADLSTGIVGSKKHWQPGTYLFAGAAHRSQNKALSEFTAYLHAMVDTMQSQSGFSLQALRLTVAGRNAPAKTLSDIATLYAVAMHQGKSEATRKNYIGWAAALAIYAPCTAVSEVTDVWLRRYDTYLKNKPSHPNAKAYTRRRKLEKVIACLQWAADENLAPAAPTLLRYKPKREKLADPIFLTPAELAALEARQERDTARVRDCFVFAAYTGLAYCDQLAFDLERDTYQDVQGRKWIKRYRQKSGVCAEIPLLPEAAALLVRYGGKMPIPTNQEYNRSLKLLAARAGIEKKLTTHVARKTCATRFLNMGISEAVICKFMGWETSQMLRVYARITRDGMELELPKLGL